MNFIKVSLFFVFTFLVVSPTYLNAKHLEFNLQHFPPYTYIEGKSLKGPFVEIVDAACQLLNHQCSFHLHRYWGSAIRSVKQDRSDALLVVGKNKSRLKWLSFSLPLMDAEYGFFVPEHSEIAIGDHYDLSGYKVGVYAPSNTAYQLAELSRYVEASGKPIIDVRWNYSTEDAIQSLLRGRVDLVYSNKLVGEAFNKTIISSPKLKYLGKHKDLQYYIGFSKKRFNKRFIKEFNGALKQLERQGILKKIFDHYQLPYIRP